MAKEEVVQNAEEKVARFLERIEERDGEINAFIELNPNVLMEAREVDKKIKKGRAGKLAGLVIAVKSNINVRGLRATCGSKTLENYVAPYDATVIERIKREDGLIIGMTNMDEFAAGSSGETSYF
jgi:aspartyl-tRNA(Asn)/glutamyl-tRNA(Gln) amidotransferase subunit A